MKFLARLMLAAVLAAVAASSVAYAAGSGEMAAAMILFDDTAEMSDCAPCSDADAGEMAAMCDIECGVGGFAAVLAPQAQGVHRTPRGIFVPAVAQTLGSLTGPPAKQPPRPLI